MSWQVCEDYRCELQVEASSETGRIWDVEHESHFVPTTVGLDARRSDSHKTLPRRLAHLAHLLPAPTAPRKFRGGRLQPFYNFVSCSPPQAGRRFHARDGPVLASTDAVSPAWDSSPTGGFNVSRTFSRGFLAHVCPPAPFIPAASGDSPVAMDCAETVSCRPALRSIREAGKIAGTLPKVLEPPRRGRAV